MTPFYVSSLRRLRRASSSARRWPLSPRLSPRRSSRAIESDSFAHAALFAALRELVATYGEDSVASFAERLPGRLRAGEFSTGAKH